MLLKDIYLTNVSHAKVKNIVVYEQEDQYVLKRIQLLSR